ncbi:MAG: class I tRNA ligase family protein, partial [Chitinophagales bacterium]
SMQSYRISESLMNLYNFIWNDFCSAYLEFIKPPFGEPIDAFTKEKTIEFYDKILKLLHPYMPFITEELYQQIETRESICITDYPTAKNIDNDAIAKGEYAKEIISAIRDIRNKNQVKPKDTLDAFVLADNESIFSDFAAKIVKLGNLSSLEKITAEVEGCESFIVKGQQFFIALGETINMEDKKADMEKELAYTQGFVKSIEKKLSNERFVNNAPEAVVTKEKQKLADGEAKIKLLTESLAKL